MKKIIIIISIIIFLIIIGLIGYNFLFKKEESTGTKITAEDGLIIQPSETITTSILNLISQEPILSPTIDNGKIKYYSKNNGNIFQIGFNGANLTRISSNILTGLIKAIWSPTDKTKVIGFFEQDEQTQKYYYDFSENQSALLDQNILSMDWSPIENKVVYQYFDSANGYNNISIANPNGTDWKNIFNTRIKDLIVEWPGSDLICVRTKPSGLAQSALYTINAAGENFQKIISKTYGLTALWSPQADKFIYSETNSQGKNLKLKLFNLASQTSLELNFSTLPEKCVWSKDNVSIFCAVPRAIADQAILPDDYYKNLVEFSDNIYKLNFETGQTDLIFSSTNSNDIDASNLLISNFEDYLVFENKKDGLLYSLEIQ